VERHRSKLLPATLGEALEGLREDTLLREALGDSIYEGFIEAVIPSVREFQRA